MFCYRYRYGCRYGYHYRYAMISGFLFYLFKWKDSSVLISLSLWLSLWLSLLLCYDQWVLLMFASNISVVMYILSSFAIVFVTTWFRVLILISYFPLSCWLFEALLLLRFDFLALCRC